MHTLATTQRDIPSSSAAGRALGNLGSRFSAHGVPCRLPTHQDAGTESLPKVILELR